MLPLLACQTALPPLLAILAGLVAAGLTFWTGLRAAVSVKIRIERMASSGVLVIA